MSQTKSDGRCGVVRLIFLLALPVLLVGFGGNGRRSETTAQSISGLRRLVSQRLNLGFGSTGTTRVFQNLSDISSRLGSAIARAFGGRAAWQLATVESFLRGGRQRQVGECEPTISYPGGRLTDSDGDGFPDEAIVDFGRDGCDLDGDGVIDIRNAVRVTDTGPGIRMEFTVDSRQLQVNAGVPGAPQFFTLGGALELQSEITEDKAGGLTIFQIVTFENLSLASEGIPTIVVDGEMVTTVQPLSGNRARVTLETSLLITVGDEPPLMTESTSTTEITDTNNNGVPDRFTQTLDQTITQGSESIRFSTGDTPLSGNFERCQLPLSGTMTVESGADRIVIDFGNPPDCKLGSVTFNGEPVGVFDFERGDFVETGATLKGTVWAVTVTEPDGDRVRDVYHFNADGTFSADVFSDCAPVPFKEKVKGKTIKFSTGRLCEAESGGRFWFKFSGTVNLKKRIIRGVAVNNAGVRFPFRGKKR